MFFCFHSFITQEPILRATQYLPGIVKLQHQLYELYHRKLDFPEANQMKITTFAEKLESGIYNNFSHAQIPQDHSLNEALVFTNNNNVFQIQKGLSFTATCNVLSQHGNW